MKKFEVEYMGGQSRNGAEAVDYMLVDCGGIELYAEMPPLEDDETGTYEDLKTEILKQAEAQGIDPEALSFRYDA